jgi:hypothetical protein
MRAKEFVAEGLYSDLQAMGRQGQAAAMATAKDKMASFRGRLTPQFFKNLSSQTAAARDKQQVEALSSQFARAWDNVVRQENSRRPSGEAMDVGEYQRTFANWLARTTQSRLSPATQAAIADNIKTTDTKLVKDFLMTSFIPGYLTAKANPVYSIPDGYVVMLDTADPRTGEKMSTRYEWDAPTAGWRDLDTGGVITGGATHAMATRSAMTQLSATDTRQGELAI